MSTARLRIPTPSGIVGVQLPLPLKYWAVRKYVQKCKRWGGGKPPLCGNLGAKLKF